MKRYVLNKNTDKLHIIDGCHHSKREYVERDKYTFELFETEDDAISKHQNYIGRCKICFKDR